jgi:hypothetical protein
MRRKQLNVFTLSFLDCISCGLGAIILLFVIVNAKAAINRDEITTDLRGEVQRMEKVVLEARKQMIIARNSLEETDDRLVKTAGLNRRIIRDLEAVKQQMAFYEDDTLASQEHINRLKADLKALEEENKRLEAGSKAEDDFGARLRRFPGTGDRQYLTDLKVGGKRIFILVDASASMLDKSIVEIIRRRHMSPALKRSAPKWQQAVKTVDWLTAQLPLKARYQIYTFNETAQPLIQGTRGQWLQTENVKQLNAAVKRLREVEPGRGTSLINAFKAVADMQPPPDNIFLLVDSLPTMGTTKSWRSKVSGKLRVQLFSKAVKKLPPRIPVNIILYPMEGDPLAAPMYWQLAVKSRGAFLSPSKDWP